jgi:hypothetical protein
MKKFLAVLICSVISFSVIFAQDNKFAVGDKVVNVGLGFGNPLYSGPGYKISVPPLSISFEQGIKDGILDKGIIGVGGYLGYAANKYETISGASGYKYSDLVVAARGAFHYPLVDKLDSYAGLTFGYNIHTSRSYGTASGIDPNSSGGITYGICIGGRYYFNDKYAAMAELGYGLTWLNLGVAIKL